MKTTTLLFFALFILTASQAWAQTDTLFIREEISDKKEEKPIRTGGELSFDTRYVWRGISQSEGPVLQPYLYFNLYDLGLGIWANALLANKPDQNNTHEIDLYLWYRFYWKWLTIEPRLETNFYPASSDNSTTAEAILYLVFDLGPIDLFLNNYVDIANAAGSYFGKFGVAYEKVLIKKLTLSTSALVGWANGRFNQENLQVNKTTINYFGFNLELLFYPVKQFYLKPFMEITTLLNTQLQQSTPDSTIIHGGLSVGFEI